MGFEPTVPLRVQRFSRPPRSTTPAPLRRPAPRVLRMTAISGGEGGIRTHDRVTPTHAFQACSLSHSDTSPRRDLRHLQRAPPPRRSPAKNSRSSAAASSSRDPGGDLEPMVQPRVPHQIAQRAAEPGLGVRGAVDQPLDPARNQRPGAHRAGLERHVERRADQPPTAAARALPRRSPASRRAPAGPDPARAGCGRAPSNSPSAETTTAPTGTSPSAAAARASSSAASIHRRSALRIGTRRPQGAAF